MFSLYQSISLLFLCFGCIASKQFRFDYTYHPDIGGWMKLHLVPVDFLEAQKLCYLEGAILASPLNDKIMKALSVEMKKSAVECLYTGVHSLYSKGYFHSLEGVSLAKMPVEWMRGEPDNYENKENCIAYITNGTVADIECTELLRFVCYKKETADMSFMPCGTTDKEYKFFATTGSCYKYHDMLLSWSEAFQVCSGEGAYLPVINSNAEATILKGLYDEKYPNGSANVITHLGFIDANRSGLFRTVQGQTLKEAGYTAWPKGQPDNASPGQYCGAMFNTGMLDDWWCDRRAHVLCEKDPDSLIN